MVLNFDFSSDNRRDINSLGLKIFAAGPPGTLQSDIKIVVLAATILFVIICFASI